MVADPLTDVLKNVRFAGAVFFDMDLKAPWVAEAPPASVIAPSVMPGSQHVMEYHVVASGSCWGNVVGERPLLLRAGDVILFPQGDPHVMSSEPGLRARPLPAPYARRAGQLLPILVDEARGDPDARVVCGFLGCDLRPFNPLVSMLPRVIHLPRRGGDEAGWLQPLLALAASESRAHRIGGECMLGRMSELLFVEVVRRWVELQPAGEAGWLNGLRDPAVGRALALLHERPAHGWTLEGLARASGMSRSALADRFTHFVGQPPMQYLARWRMQIAAGALASGGATVSEAASQAGYSSEAAFSRAFKKLVGTPPAEWRRRRLTPAPVAARPARAPGPRARRARAALRLARGDSGSPARP